MEELCIITDSRDNIIGFDTKKNAHLMARGPPLHRAFSVFLFDTQGRLLLQQRAAEKITFPSLWTNTVCSHPLKNVEGYGNADGSDESDGVDGVKRAAVRKLRHELGVELRLSFFSLFVALFLVSCAHTRLPKTPSVSDLTYLTRIHYLAPSDGVWGEHEIDYILFARKNVPHQANANEVRDTMLVDRDEMRAFFKRTDVQFTPWFKIIVEGFIYKWWDALLDGSLDKHVDLTTIHKPY